MDAYSQPQKSIQIYLDEIHKMQSDLVGNMEGIINDVDEESF